MRTVETEVYKFEELDERAQEKARDWYREGNLDYDWWDFVYDDAEAVASLLGIEMAHKHKHTPAIYFSGFSSQGDGACFEGDYAYKRGAPKAVRDYAPQDDDLYELAVRLQKLQAPRFYHLVASTKQHGFYNHSGCMAVDVRNASDWGTCTVDDEEDITQCLREFADWIYYRLRDEYEYQNADEQVDESIIANEYEFTEDGEVA